MAPGSQCPVLLGGVVRLLVLWPERAAFVVFLPVSGISGLLASLDPFKIHAAERKKPREHSAVAPGFRARAGLPRPLSASPSHVRALCSYLVRAYLGEEQTRRASCILLEAKSPMARFLVFLLKMNFLRGAKRAGAEGLRETTREQRSGAVGRTRIQSGPQARETTLDPCPQRPEDREGRSCEQRWWAASLVRVDVALCRPWGPGRATWAACPPPDCTVRDVPTCAGVREDLAPEQSTRCCQQIDHSALGQIAEHWVCGPLSEGTGWACSRPHDPRRPALCPHGR